MPVKNVRFPVPHDAPTISRRKPFSFFVDSEHNKTTNKQTTNKKTLSTMPVASTNKVRQLRHMLTLSDFQDGAPQRSDGERRGSFSFNLNARGNLDSAVQREKSMNDVRRYFGLYMNYPLANDLLEGADQRAAAFKRSGTKQMNHVRGTDGWWPSMLAIEVRAIDNYLGPWCWVCINAFVATFLSEVAGFEMSHEILRHWDTVYSLVLKTSLAFLLVFRLNRCAMRFWEARSLWGNLTHLTRNLSGGILMYCKHSPRNRDAAVRWVGAFCVAAMHFIRSEHEYDVDELAGFISAAQIKKMQDANHAPLYVASFIRHYLREALKVDANTPVQLAHAYSIQLNTLEQLVTQMVAQVSGMEKIRSTPLPIAYVSHLRTFLFAYCMFLPYIWVNEWGWATIPLCAFTAFALFGIEGASSEVEIPFDRSRPNHLALEAYCLIMLDSVQGLAVQDANIETQNSQDTIAEGDEEEDEDSDVFGV